MDTAHFADRSVFFHINADARGDAFQRAFVIVPDGAQPANFIRTIDAELETSNRSARAIPKRRLTIRPRGPAPVTITLTPGHRFPDEGIGLSQPDLGPWPLQGRARGRTRGTVFAELDPLRSTISISSFRAKRCGAGWRSADKGIGVFEQLSSALCADGLCRMTDPAP